MTPRHSFPVHPQQRTFSGSFKYLKRVKNRPCGNGRRAKLSFATKLSILRSEWSHFRGAHREQAIQCMPDTHFSSPFRLWSDTVISGPTSRRSRRRRRRDSSSFHLRSLTWKFVRRTWRDGAAFREKSSQLLCLEPQWRLLTYWPNQGDSMVRSDGCQGRHHSPRLRTQMGEAECVGSSATRRREVFILGR